MRSEGASPGPALIINHEKLSPLLGRPTGKSKFMCVQFCLSVAEISSSAEAATGVEDNIDAAMDIDMNADGDGDGDGDGDVAADMGVDSTFVVPTVFQEELKALSIGRTAGSIEEEEGNADGEGNNDTDSDSDNDDDNDGDGDGDSDDTLSPSSSSNSALLEEAKVAALKGLNDRSGTTLSPSSVTVLMLVLLNIVSFTQGKETRYRLFQYNLLLILLSSMHL
jgi:hypothetical protein